MSENNNSVNQNPTPATNELTPIPSNADPSDLLETNEYSVYNNKLRFNNGLQDKFLTNDPAITYFKASMKKYGDFAIDTKKIEASGNFGQIFDIKIPRMGDLVHKIYIEITLDASSTSGDSSYINWVNNTAHSIIESVEFYIGGFLVDKHDSVFLDILTEIDDASHEDWLLLNKHRAKNAYLRSKTELVPNKLFIPLQFWFCKNPGMAFPIVSVPESIEIRLRAKFRNLESLINCDGTSASVQFGNNKVSVYVDYIHLTEMERTMFMEENIEYLIEQTQVIKNDVRSNMINISEFNHPVKELIWVFREKECLVENTKSSNLSGIDPSLNKDGSAFSQGNDFLNYGCANQKNNLYVGGFQNFDHFNKVSLQINGSEFFPFRDAVYFRTIQPLTHHGVVPEKNIYIYSFALRPNDQQPTGTLNFSQVDKNTYLSFEDINIGSEISVYAVSYNVLRIQKKKKVDNEIVKLDSPIVQVLFLN